MNKPRSLDDSLQTIVVVACNSVPGFDLVVPLDKVQYGLREGPCSPTLHGLRQCPCRACDTSSGGRYVPQARDAGVRSQLAVKLYLDEGTLGGINFYSGPQGGRRSMTLMPRWGA